ncbi:MAG: site-specific integrase [Candidatus Levybacteria bacterium]|nr:site-specific integrase [Candidatus Levybacteria bacterium]
MTHEAKRPEALPRHGLSQTIRRYIDSDDFLRHARSENTRHAYESDLVSFGDYCASSGSGSIETLSNKRIDNWFETMSQSGFSEATLNRKKSSLLGFLHWAAERNLFDTSLLRKPLSNWLEIIKSKPSNGLTGEQLTILLNAAGDQPSLRDAVFIQIALQTGVMLEQIVDLDRRDIVIQENGQMGIRLYNRKDDDYDIKPLDEEAKNVVLGYLTNENTDPDNPLFPGWRHNERITRQGLWLILKKYRAIIGVRNLTPTTLRNTYFDHQREKKSEF